MGLTPTADALGSLFGDAPPDALAEGDEAAELQFGLTPEEARKCVQDVRKDYAEMREARRKHESKWFLAGAFLRGQQHVEFNEGIGQLISMSAPSYRIKLDLNRIRPKLRARMSKFFKGRPKPVVVPASTDLTDIQNARATEKILRYHWERLHGEEKYRDARWWACITGKAFWFFYIDPDAIAIVQDPDTGEKKDARVGDVCIEDASAFEMLVKDPAISRLGNQPKIQRVRMMAQDEIERRWGVPLEEKQGDGDRDTNFADRLATIAKDSSGMTSIPRGAQSMVIEDYLAPCAKFPKGRVAIVIEDKLAHFEAELPYGMWRNKTNPYPCVEFADTNTPGQFWTTTFIEQLIDVQRQYNYLFELLMENTRACARPKFIVYRQHNLAEGAWSTSAGEIVELSYVPGLPPPIVLQAPSIAGDVWNLIAYYDRLFDELTQIYPASEGAVAKSTSGFQTNLLQEATDSVHAPDVREDELTLQDAMWKVRRLCKIWYDVPRLFSVMGSNSLPEAIEFSKDQIDEHAEVRIQVGSMLPDMKAARSQTALEFYSAGLFGPQQDPRTQRRVLDLVDLGGMETAVEDNRRDTDEAERENQKMAAGEPVNEAAFYQDQLTHVDRHQNFMKSPAFLQLDAQTQVTFLTHVITHYDWLNPQMAMSLRTKYGIMVASSTPPLPPAPALGAPAPDGSAPPLGSPEPQAPALPPGQGPPPQAMQ